MAVPIARRRFTVEDYHRMAEAGILGEDDRVELIAGEIVEMSPVGGRHVEAVSRFTRLLSRQVGDGMLVNVQSPIRLTNDGEPEPDTMVLRGGPRDYADRRRMPADAALIIEVSHTSYGYDRNDKWITYAAARIPVYWILDLNRRRLEVHTEPTGEGEGTTYTQTQFYGPDDEAPLVLDGREVARFPVREILP